MRIELYFNDGSVRKYEVSDEMSKMLDFGDSISVEFCNPKFGEVCCVSQGQLELSLADRE